MWAIEAVAGLVVEDAQILLIRETGSRPEIGKFAGMLSVPMGHIDAGEAPEKAVVREFREETDLEVTVEYPLGFYEIVMPEGERAGVWAFKCRRTDSRRETAKTIWMSIEEFLALDPFVLRPLNRDLFQVYIRSEDAVLLRGIERAIERFQAATPHVAFQVPTETP